MFLRLGDEPLLLPEPLATLTRKLRDTPPERTTTTVNTSSPWLFPGRLPRHHLTRTTCANASATRHQSAARRNSAVLQLGQTVPAAILADLLGFAASTTERWTQLAARRLDPLRHHTPSTAAGPHSASALRAPAP